MSCRIDHSAPDTIPEPLCRACHPRVASGQGTAQELSKRLADEDALARLERELRGKRITLAATSPKARKARAKLEAEIEKLCGRIADAM